MLTQKQVIDAVKAGRGHNRGSCAMLDGRDYSRLIDFFPAREWDVFGFTLKDGANAPTPKEWNAAVIKEALASDLAFAFEKALNKRGISSSLMHAVVQMWMWVLEDPLQNDDEYAQYGLPLYRKVAVKYGLPNPIGDDHGDEPQYAE